MSWRLLQVNICLWLALTNVQILYANEALDAGTVTWGEFSRAVNSGSLTRITGESVVTTQIEAPSQFGALQIRMIQSDSAAPTREGEPSAEHASVSDATVAHAAAEADESLSLMLAGIDKLNQQDSDAAVSKDPAQPDDDALALMMAGIEQQSVPAAPAQQTQVTSPESDEALTMILSQINAAEAEAEDAEVDALAAFASEVARSETQDADDSVPASPAESPASPESPDMSIVTRLAATTAIAGEVSRQLLGLFVDDAEHPALMVAHDGNEYLLPLVTILDHAGASLNSEGAGESLRVSTPGGPITLEPSDLRLVSGQVMITQTALREKMLVAVEFQQSSYALHMSLPWSLKRVSPLLSFDVPDPDFTPPSASLRNLRGDWNLFSNPQERGDYGDYFIAGNLAGGGWQARAQQQTDGGIVPADFFWTRDFGNALALAGHSNYSLHPLLATIEQTGVQYLYSSSSLSASQSVDITRANGTRRIANGVRDISGMATPGAMAELRVDGSVVTRARVRLDGSYDFPEVELPTRGFAEVQVMILDNRSGALLDTQDFSRRSGIELLGDRQYSVFSTLGVEGNGLDHTQRSQGLSGAVQWRYGLSEDTTIELGRQQVGSNFGNQASVSFALSRHWFASLAYADSNRRSAIGLDLEGGDETWRVDFSTREFTSEATSTLPASALVPSSDQANPYDMSPGGAAAEERQWSRSVSLRYKLGEAINIGVIGRDIATEYEQHRFILPSVSWSNRDNLTISARPNSEGEYRLDSRFTPSAGNTIRYAFENEAHLVDYRHRAASGREYYVNYSEGPQSPRRFEMGLSNQFDDQRFGSIEAALVSNDDDIGYSLEWEASFVPGINSRLRISKGGYQRELSEADSELFLQWQVTFDFAVAQNRIVAIDSGSAATDSAALTGDLMLNGKKISSEFDIENIELLIDGDPHTAAVRSGRYYIDDLAPGMHKVGIDARHLPLELSPVAGQSYWVRLEKAAATEMPLALEERYSVAGRVRDSEGNNAANTRLVVLNAQGATVSEVYTDQFGLYRTDSLPPGDYRIAIQEGNDLVAAIRVTITDSYLFEQDLLIPAVMEHVAL